MPDIQSKSGRGFKRILKWLVVVCILILAFVFWWKYYFVFGEGVKSGELNYVVKKETSLKPMKES